MGFNHARVYAELDSAQLVGVADPSPAVRERIARRLRIPTYDDHRTMLSETRPDAVSVVVPTRLHHAVTSDAIDAGCHVLVEKPIASTVEEGADLIIRAADRGVALSVGHVERFNPAVRALRERIARGDLGEIYQVHARRLGPFPSRVRDVGVVIDLATHDVDVMRYLLDAEVERVFGETARRIHTDHEDLLSGLLRFSNGTIGVLDVNWLTPTKIRALTVTGQKGMFAVDYISQDLHFFQNDDATRTWHSGDERLTVSEGDMVRIRIERQEALAAELSAFIDAALGLQPLEVTGWDGLEALRITTALVASGRESRAIDLAPSIRATR